MRDLGMKASTTAAACMAGLLFACALPVAAPADAPMTSVQRNTHISAYRGTLAWSQFVPDKNHYRLMLTDTKTGKTTMPGIGWRENPFDVTLGPDAKGRTVALYSHCDPANDALSGNRTTGCDAYRYDLARKKETKLGFNSDRDSEEWPAQWKEQYSYVEVRVGGTAYQRQADNRCDRVLSQRKDGARVKLNAHGTCGMVTGQVLRGTTVAQTVAFSKDPLSTKARKYTEVRVLSTKGGAGTRLLLSKFLDGSDLYSSPVMDDKYVYVVRTGAAVTPRFVRIHLKTGRVQEVEAQTPLTGAMARDGRISYYVEQPGDPTAPLAPCALVRPCRIVKADQDIFGSAERTLGPRLTFNTPPGTVFGNLPLNVSGALTQPVVRGGKVVGSVPVGGALLEGYAVTYAPGMSEPSMAPTGRTAMTGGDGTWGLTIPPPLPLGGQYLAVARGLSVPVHSPVVSMKSFATVTLTAAPGGAGKVVFSGTVEPADLPGRRVQIKQRLGDASNEVAEAPLAADGRAFSVEAPATVGAVYYAELPPDPGYYAGEVERRTGTSSDLTVTQAG